MTHLACISHTVHGLARSLYAAPGSVPTPTLPDFFGQRLEADDELSTDGGADADANGARVSGAASGAASAKGSAGGHDEDSSEDGSDEADSDEGGAGGGAQTASGVGKASAVKTASHTKVLLPGRVPAAVDAHEDDEGAVTRRGVRVELAATPRATKK